MNEYEVWLSSSMAGASEVGRPVTVHAAAVAMDHGRLTFTCAGFITECFEHGSWVRWRVSREGVRPDASK